MCFRPAAVDAERTCPHCGEKVGSADSVCASCGAELPKGSMAPGAPGVPGAPGIPAAPGAPKVPGAPPAPLTKCYPAWRPPPGRWGRPAACTERIVGCATSWALALGPGAKRGDFLRERADKHDCRGGLGE